MPALVAAAVLSAGVIALLATPHRAEAALPGENGDFLLTGTNRDGETPIYTMGPNGSPLTLLATFPGYAGDAVWSPDGAEIALTHENEIYRMDADGSNRVRLTDTPGANWEPTWSPDGTKIAFEYHTSHVSTDDEIYVVNADGSEERNLTDNQSGYDDWYPVWAPDGAKVAFVSGRVLGYDREGEIYETSIRTINVDGSADTKISSEWLPLTDWQRLGDPGMPPPRRPSLPIPPT